MVASAFAQPFPGSPLTPSAPWQRADSTWLPVFDSPAQLGVDTLRILRYGLTLILARRQEVRRKAERSGQLPPCLLVTYPLEEVAQRRFFATALHGLTRLDILRFLSQEVEMTVSVLETPPRPQPNQTWRGWLTQYERWHALLAQQCLRIGQLAADLTRRLGAREAQGALARVLDQLAPETTFQPPASSPDAVVQ